MIVVPPGPVSELELLAQAAAGDRLAHAFLTMATMRLTPVIVRELIALYRRDPAAAIHRLEAWVSAAAPRGERPARSRRRPRRPRLRVIHGGRGPAPDADHRDGSRT